MVTEAQISDFRRANDQIQALAFRDLKALLLALQNPNPVLYRERLVEALPELLRPYMTVSADVAATWYEDLRPSTKKAFFAEPVTNYSRPQVDALVRWSVSPLFGQSDSTVLSLLAGGSQRMIENASRDTIISNTGRDSIRVGYARIPRAGCCSFCGMLASRGAVYSSSASAGGTVGRGVDASETAGKRGGQGRGVKARGSRDLGDTYHDFCRCVVAPVFTGEDNSYIQYTKQFYYDLYPGTGNLPKGTNALKSVLAQWREENGTK